MRTIEFGEKLVIDLLDSLLAAVPDAVGVGVSLLAAPDRGDADAVGKPEVAAAVGLAVELDPPQWRDVDSLLWLAVRSGQVISRGVADLPAAPEGVTAPVWDTVRGMVASPGEWGGALPVVLSIYLDTSPRRDHLAQIDRHEPLITQALGFVRYCQGETERAEQMLQMTHYRRVIEQAKGLIMAVVGGDAEGAFVTLSRASQHFNVPLRRLAVALVEHVGGSVAEHPEDEALSVTPAAGDRAVAARIWAAFTAATTARSG